MMHLLMFIIVTTMLTAIGSLACRLLLKTREVFLLLSLGLPVGALINALIIFVLTVTGLPLTPLTILLPITTILCIELFLIRTYRRIEEALPHPEKAHGNLLTGIVTVWSAVIILGTIFYSFSHAVLLPTFQYDSATNWTMRSEISFYDREVAFDANEDRGMAKPQYPILFHALQITANQGQTTWNDSAANVILWLHSLSGMTGLFLMLTTLSGVTTSLAIIALLLSIPLFSLHLGQGYADITLVIEILLALQALFVFERSKNGGWLLLSALMAASAIWTKSEGLFFALIPWLLILGVAYWRRKEDRSIVKKAVWTGVALSLPWPIFAVAHGFLLTPHSSDLMLKFHGEGFTEAFRGLFDRGSFGILWYVLALAVPWMLTERRKERKLLSAHAAGLLWGGLTFLGILGIYLCTPNVRFLLNAESYYRQMMVPATIFTLTVSLWFSQRKKVTP